MYKKNHISVSLNRRKFLTQSGKIASVGLLAGPLPTTVMANDLKVKELAEIQISKDKLMYDFFGQHQAGIITPQQDSIYFMVLDLHTTDINAIREMFKLWTKYAERLMQGLPIEPKNNNPYIPPVDTGETADLAAHGLTLTFGISPSFIKKLDLTHKAPPELKELPAFPRDQIKTEWSGGDICIQACANSMQVAFHAIRQLVKAARLNVTMRWAQTGFISTDSHVKTPRNLFGFKDGTANSETLLESEKYIWSDTPDWMNGGSYLVVRKIAMHLETWDRTSGKEQENTFGRNREEGAFFGQEKEFDSMDMTKKDTQGEPLIPKDSHAFLARTTGVKQLRRAYSYANGVDPKTGQFDSGLLFICFQRDPQQFITIQRALGNVDKLNEYITHIGSGLFACFGGVKPGEYLAQALLNDN